MNKKGQAAMEFLMTYGWAILVVIAAIAALAYFGVLDPARLLPERCQFPAGMDCIDKASIVGESAAAANDGTVTVALRNNQGFPVVVSLASATVGSCTTSGLAVGAGTTVGAMNQTVPNNEVFRVELSGCDLTAGSKFDGDFTVSYTNTESGLSNQAVGSVRGRVA
jgi:hypothetical protein